MIFSKRLAVAEEYKRWLASSSEHIDKPLMDCPFAVITFLDSVGLLKQKREENNLERVDKRSKRK